MASKRKGPVSREYRAVIEIDPEGLSASAGRVTCLLRILNIGSVTWSSNARAGRCVWAVSQNLPMTANLWHTPRLSFSTIPRASTHA